MIVCVSFPVSCLFSKQRGQRQSSRADGELLWLLFLVPLAACLFPSSLLSISLLHSVNFSSLPTFPSFLSSNAAFLLDGLVHLTPL